MVRQRARRGRPLAVCGAAVTLVALSACSTPAAAPEASGSTGSVAESTPTGCTTPDTLATWTLPRLAAQTLVAPVTMTDLDRARGEVRSGVAGLLLFGSSVPADLRDRLAALSKAADVPLLVSTDEEGGSVQRVRDLVGAVPSARTMARTLSPDQLRALGDRIGSAMLEAGITVDLAPVLDLDDRPGPSSTNPDGTRSFGLDPRAAADAALAFAQGLRDAGVTPVVKHFPGLGYSTGNTDDRPAATKPWAAVQRADLLPFADAVTAGIPAVMVANARVPGLTDQPASLSSEVIEGVLRGQLGFTGVAVTDSLSAQAIASAGYSVPQASVAALAAGADLVLYGGGGSNDPAVTRRTIRAIAAAVEGGTLHRERLEEAVARVLALKRVDACSLPAASG